MTARIIYALCAVTSLACAVLLLRGFTQTRARLLLWGGLCFACLFVIAVLWLLEWFEPPARSRFDLKISAKHAPKLRPDIEHALEQRGVTFDLRGSSPTELMYEVTIPFGQKIRPLTKLIRGINGHSHEGPLVDWEIKKYETLRP